MSRPVLSTLFVPLLLLAMGAGTAQARVRHHHASASVTPVEVGIIAFNDFHGSLEPPHQAVVMPDGKGGRVQVPAGGAAWFAGAVEQLRARYRHHLTVSAGDMTGASQLASSLYLDEPTIGVMNRLGVDFNAVGNHEFDRGKDELLRLQSGGCHQWTAHKPCALEPFVGAKFRYLAASTVDQATGQTLFPASALRRFGTGRGAVMVGVIGLALKDVPSLVNAAGIPGLAFRDEADTINAQTAQLKAAGADAVIVLIHQGGRTAEPDPDGCKGLTGDIRPILDRLDHRVDLVVSGHTHWDYICRYPVEPGHSVLLTSAGLYGKEVTDIALTIDPVAHRVIAARAHNVIVQSQPFASPRGPVALIPAVPQIAPDPAIAAYVARYVAAAGALTGRVVGHLSGPVQRGEGAHAGEGGPLGNIIADSQVFATQGAGAQIALMNPLGIRAALVPGDGGAVTFGAIYAVQPFGNALVTQTMTGAQLKATLEQGIDDKGPFEVLSPSAGFAWRFDRARPEGDRVTAMTFMGQPVDPAARYRVTVNGFLAQGGDGFTGFVGKPDAVTGPTDIDAFESWLAAAPLRTVATDVRAVGQ